jgi:hypothetical protein
MSGHRRGARNHAPTWRDRRFGSRVKDSQANGARTIRLIDQSEYYLGIESDRWTVARAITTTDGNHIGRSRHY